MAKKKSETVEKTAVPEPTTDAPDLISAAVEHMTRAAVMLRSKGGKKAESCAHVAGQLDRWIAQLEKLNE
jgi:hypothetical protein